MQAKDVMSSPVISIPPETTLREIMQLLSDRQISSVPVVNEHAQVLGIIGWRELFPSARYIRASDVRVPAVFKRITDPKSIVASYKAAAHLTAREIMSTHQMCRDIHEKLDELIHMMAEENLHMIPIVEDSRLVGVVTRTDVIRYLAKEL